MKCPGQDSRYWKPGAIFQVECPACGNGVEFFKDDTTRVCKKCGHRFLNPNMDFGCASYCQHAEQCIGNLSPELMAQKEDLLRDRVAIETKRYFKGDFKRIGRAMRVARYAEQIGKEEGGSLAVILTAAYLYDMGVKGTEATHEGNVTGFEKENVQPAARELLLKAGAREELIREVCEIIGHRCHPGQEGSLNLKIVSDAVMIAELEEKQKEDPSESEELARIIGRSILTKSGRILAERIVMKGKEN
jgi:hypothetical protein